MIESTVQHFFDFVMLLVLDNFWGRRQFVMMSKGVVGGKCQFDDWKDWV